MAKPPRPGVRIRFNAQGQMIRRKRRMTKAEVAASKAVEPTTPPDRAKVIAAMARARIAGRENTANRKRVVETEAAIYDSRRRKAAAPLVDAFAQVADRLERGSVRDVQERRRRGRYLAEVARRRAAAGGGESAAAEKEQVQAYRSLEVDLKAGFEGRPPAFHIVGREKTDSGAVLIRAKNVARDPIRILWTQGSITKRQYLAAVALTDLLEQHASVGLRACSFSEAVDGGKMPDVSTHALAVARKMAAWETAFNDRERGLLKAVTIDRQTISDLARIGTYGANRARVKEKLTAALEELADWFGVR